MNSNTSQDVIRNAMKFKWAIETKETMKTSVDYLASDLVFEVPNVFVVHRKPEKRPSKEMEHHEKKSGSLDKSGSCFNNKLIKSALMKQDQRDSRVSESIPPWVHPITRTLNT